MMFLFGFLCGASAIATLGHTLGMLLAVTEDERIRERRMAIIATIALAAAIFGALIA